MQRLEVAPTLRGLVSSAPSNRRARAPRGPDRSTGRKALLGLALLAFVLALYLPVRHHDFVLYDDDLLITLVEPVAGGLSVDGVRWALTSTEAANWMPLTRLSWLLDVELFGLAPGAFHATNALLHALATLLWFLALERLTGAALRSALVAALFAAHPLNVEAVAWAAARRDVLAGVFAAASLLAYAGPAGGAERRRLGWTAGWLAAGLLSKPMLVSWPLVLLLVDVWPLRRLTARADLAPRLREKLPLLALAALSAGVTLWTQSRSSALQLLSDLGPWVRAKNALAAYAAYTGDAFWPSGLAVFYPHPGDEIALSGVVAGAALLLGVAAVSFGLRRRCPALGVGWLWYVGMLVPVIGLVQVGQAARADRYLYLPGIGLWIALVWTLFDAVRPYAALRRVAAGAALAGLVALSLVTRAQIAHWKDSQSLFLHALRVTERNHVAHINLGLWLTRQGRLDEAAAHLLAGLRASPGSSVGSGLLANVRVAQGRSAEAIQLYRRALAIEPTAHRWRRKLAALLLAEGRDEEAAAVLDEGDAPDRRVGGDQSDDQSR